MVRFKTCFILLTVIIGIKFSDSLDCYSCSGIDSVDLCIATTRCADLQSCFLNISSAGFTLGCTDNQKCGALSQVSASLVGRDLKTDRGLARQHDDIQEEMAALFANLPNMEYRAKRQIHNCFECCSSDVCNKHLCDHLKPSACIDDAKVDCAWMNSRLNICQNIHEAKLICPRFCGLCNLVDGEWADWSAWSACDVTCANGTLSRTRQCSNPAPAGGGLDCLGSSIEVKNCSLAPCPVHGGWTAWFSWESCSVTCDIGIQLRHRNCSNPPPQLFGDHCFGDSLEVRMCTPGPCANGEWSFWGSWSDCSASCGGGIKTRHRTCTSPLPSTLGRPCEGDPIEVTACISSPCLTPTIAFRSKDVTNTNLSTPQTLVFKTTILNAGYGYNNRTGVFTAPLAGMYSFSIHICVSAATRYTYYAIIQNGTIILKGSLKGSDTIVECLNFDTVAVLNEHDGIWVQLRLDTGSVYEDILSWNMFSGYLVHV